LLGLGRSLVLVDHTAENLAASDRGIERDRGGRVVVGWVLVEALVRAVVVEVVGVVARIFSAWPRSRSRIRLVHSSRTERTKRSACGLQLGLLGGFLSR
jgi:hypothetical protein